MSENAHLDKNDFSPSRPIYLNFNLLAPMVAICMETSIELTTQVQSN